MSRKDYELIADAIAGTEHAHRDTLGSVAVLRTLIDVLGAKLENDNPRFDRKRFEAAALPAATKALAAKLDGPALGLQC